MTQVMNQSPYKGVFRPFLGKGEHEDKCLPVLSLPPIIPQVFTFY